MKGCGIFAVIAFVGLALFCGLGAFAVRRGVERAKEAEAKMTPQERAERDQRRKEQDERNKRRTTELVMVKATEAAVSKMLKTPSVAKFDLDGSMFGERLVLVGGHVDSQNSFGAMVRTEVRARFVDEKLAYIRLGNEEMKGELYDESERLVEEAKKK